MKVEKWGTSEGYGAVVSNRGFFGRVRTYTRLKSEFGLDKWVCIEDGSWQFASECLCKFHTFYLAQYNTKDAR